MSHGFPSFLGMGIQALKLIFHAWEQWKPRYNVWNHQLSNPSKLQPCCCTSLKFEVWTCQPPNWTSILKSWVGSNIGENAKGLQSWKSRSRRASIIGRHGINIDSHLRFSIWGLSHIGVFKLATLGLKFEGLCNKIRMDISFFVQIYLGTMTASTPIILFLKTIWNFPKKFLCEWK